MRRRSPRPFDGCGFGAAGTEVSVLAVRRSKREMFGSSRPSVATLRLSIARLPGVRLWGYGLVGAVGEAGPHHSGKCHQSVSLFIRPAKAAETHAFPIIRKHIYELAYYFARGWSE